MASCASVMHLTTFGVHHALIPHRVMCLLAKLPSASHLQADIADALNTSSANVQLLGITFSPPDRFSVKVVATIPLVTPSPADSNFGGASSSGSVRNTILGVTASYESTSSSEGASGSASGSSTSSASAAADAAVAAAAANELDADSLVQVRGASLARSALMSSSQNLDIK